MGFCVTVYGFKKSYLKFEGGSEGYQKMCYQSASISKLRLMSDVIPQTL